MLCSFQHQGLPGLWALTVKETVGFPHMLYLLQSTLMKSINHIKLWIVSLFWLLRMPPTPILQGCSVSGQCAPAELQSCRPVTTNCLQNYLHTLYMNPPNQLWTYVSANMNYEWHIFFFIMPSMAQCVKVWWLPCCSVEVLRCCGAVETRLTRRSHRSQQQSGAQTTWIPGEPLVRSSQL